MSEYLNSLNEEVKDYFKVLSPLYPLWLDDYINTKVLKRLSKISMNCGTDYSKCFNVQYFYSNLEHSVGVALILWHFTKDKKQTLAGLFHEIANPTFRHCIDFMYDDSLKQEKTQKNTKETILASTEIINLLKRDNISMEEVCDYKKYPLADNETPKLAADRLEYNFSGGLTLFKVWDISDIKEIYNNITILKNEDGKEELGFTSLDIGEKYLQIVSKLWPSWISDTDRTLMQFYADMCKSLSKIGELTVKDLYSLSEKEIIDKFLNCKDSYLKEVFQNFLKVTKAYSSDIYKEDKYCVKVTTKSRYIIPLVRIKGKERRITEVSSISQKIINDYLNIPKGGYYTYFDFAFKPYN